MAMKMMMETESLMKMMSAPRGKMVGLLNQQMTTMEMVVEMRLKIGTMIMMVLMMGLTVVTMVN